MTDTILPTTLGLVWYDPFGGIKEGSLYLTIRSLRSNGQCVCYAQRKPGPMHEAAYMGLYSPQGNDFFEKVRAFIEFASTQGLQIEHPSICLARFIIKSIDSKSNPTELILEIKESSPEQVHQTARELLSYLSSELKRINPELSNLGAKPL